MTIDLQPPDIEHPTEFAPRTCASCACHLVQENQLNKLEKQSFCRRDTPQAAKLRSERPQMINGQPRMMKDGKTHIMETFDSVIYLYKPTMPELVCFDGWRPLDTLPGERAATELSSNIMSAMARLYKDMVMQSDEAEAEAEAALLSDLPVDDAKQNN